jgi:hypothetical protein
MPQQPEAPREAMKNLVVNSEADARMQLFRVIF